MAKVFDQCCGIDYHETFSPVIKPSTISLVLSLAVTFNWPIKQLECPFARFLDEEVCMEQTQGFVGDSKPDFVC